MAHKYKNRTIIYFLFVRKDLGFYFHLRKSFFWLEILERHPHHEFTAFLARIFAHFLTKTENAYSPLKYTYLDKPFGLDCRFIVGNK